MKIVNMTDAPAQVKLVNEKGQLDYAHLMPKKQVTLPQGFKIEPNWSVNNPNVKIVKED